MLKNNDYTQILEIQDRSKLSVTGLIEVIDFTENSVCIFTKMGDVTIKGENLQILKSNKDTGEFALCGYILSVIYGENNQRSPQNFITRLFK